MYKILIPSNSAFKLAMKFIRAFSIAVSRQGRRNFTCSTSKHAEDREAAQGFKYPLQLIFQTRPEMYLCAFQGDVTLPVQWRPDEKLRSQIHLGSWTYPVTESVGRGISTLHPCHKIAQMINETQATHSTNQLHYRRNHSRNSDTTLLKSVIRSSRKIANKLSAKLARRNPCMDGVLNHLREGTAHCR